MINHNLAIYLMVTGYGDDPDTITHVLDLAPTEVWVCGQTFSGDFPEARRTRSQWMLASGLPFDAAFRDHCAQLLGLLEARADRLHALATQYPVSLAVGLYYHTSDPAFFIEEDIIERLRALGLDPHFDQIPHFPSTNKQERA